MYLILLPLLAGIEEWADVVRCVRGNLAQLEVYTKEPPREIPALAHPTNLQGGPIKIPYSPLPLVPMGRPGARVILRE